MSELWEERQIKELAELIGAYKRRLHKLQLRVAMEGRDARPEDLNESEDIEGKLQDLEARYKELCERKIALSDQEAAQFAQTREVLKQKLEQPLGIRAAFANREEELRTILSPLSLPFIGVSAPAGYGKSYLLTEAEHRLKSGGWGKWLAVRVNCTEDDSETSIMEGIAREIGYKGTKPIKTLDEFNLVVRRALKDGQDDGLFILFDALERWKKHAADVRWQPVAHSVKHSLIPTLDETIRREGWQFRAIFAGRYIEDWEENFPLPYRPLPLSPFGKEIIRMFIQETLRAYERRKGLRLGYQLEELERWAEEMLEITGGHPGAIVKVMEYIGDTPREFNFPLSNPESPAYFFRADNKERLFRDFVSGEVPGLLEGVAYPLREVFQVISVFRGFNVDTLRALLNRGYVKGFKDGWTLYRQILSTRLIKDEALLSRDEILQRVLDAQARFTKPLSEEYKNFHFLAVELYDQFLHGRDHLGQPFPGGVPPSGSDQIRLMVEGLYHLCWATEGEEDRAKTIIEKLETYLRQLYYPAGQWAYALRQKIEQDEQLPGLLKRALGQGGYNSFLTRIEQFGEEGKR